MGATVGNTSLAEFSEGQVLAENYSLENATSRIVQSKFFSSTFNTAIFDGPLRVYFSQSQEPEALKVYFSLQSKFFKEANIESLKEHLPKGSTLFIMIYPNQECFEQSFDQACDFAVANLEQDCVIGVQGPVSDKTCDDILSYVKDNFKRN
jgi:hypothetical protein